MERYVFLVRGRRNAKIFSTKVGLCSDLSHGIGFRLDARVTEKNPACGDVQILLGIKAFPPSQIHNFILNSFSASLLWFPVSSRPTTAFECY